LNHAKDIERFVDSRLEAIKDLPLEQCHSWWERLLYGSRYKIPEGYENPLHDESDGCQRPAELQHG
jgi:hypothetical protein